MDEDAAVKDLYERFPYPPPIDDLTPFTEGRRAATWNPRDSWSLYFPEEPSRKDPDILVAGCGTRAAVMMAACMPEARVMAIDISESSLAISEETARRGNLQNLEHRRLPLEEIATLGRDFDLVHCHGVLHHLADPGAGLRALGDVLRPQGAMSLMVYARYGRSGLYMLQDLGQLLDLAITEETAVDLQTLCRVLPQSHPFHKLGHSTDKLIAIPEVMDMLMHPRDVSYDVPGIRSLVDDADLRFHRWIGQAPYSISCSPLADCAIGQRIAELPPWDRWTAMELLRGTIKTHDFVVTHKGRPTADALFSGDGLLDAIPSQAAHVGFEQTEDQVIVFSRAHKGDRVHGMSVTEKADALSALFRCFRDERTVRTILEEETRAAPNPALHEWMPRTCRRLYEADVVALRSG